MNNYPIHPGFKATAENTSREAADAIAPRVESVREQVFNLLKQKCLAADECADHLGYSILTVRPRISELKRLGLIYRVEGITSKNRSGRNAAIWAAKNTGD